MNEPKQPANIGARQLSNHAIFGLAVAENITLMMLRLRPGVDQPGFDWLFTFLLIPIIGIEAGSVLVMRYWYLWILMSTVYRGSSNRDQISYYVGYPWVFGLFFKTERAACLAEALTVTGLGYISSDRGMRWLLLLAGGSSLINELVFRFTEDRKRIEINNAKRQMERHQGYMK